MNDALCSFCQDLFRGEIDEWDARSGYGNDLESLDSEETDEDDEKSFRRSGRYLKNQPHHDSVDQLQQCGENSCRLCAAFWGQLSHKRQQEWKVSETNIKASGVGDEKTRLLCDLWLELWPLSIRIELNNEWGPSSHTTECTLDSYCKHFRKIHTKC
jgi:hypothetical protein